MGKKTGVHTGLVAYNLSTPHNIAVVNVIHTLDGCGRSDGAFASLDSSIRLLLGIFDKGNS